MARAVAGFGGCQTGTGDAVTALSVEPARLAAQRPVRAAECDRFRIADAALVGLLVWLALPETLIGEAAVFGVPVEYVLYSGVVAGCALALVHERLSRLDRPIVMVATCWVAMAGLGLFFGNELKFWVVDVLNASALVVGLYWGARRSRRKLLARLAVCGSAVAVIHAFAIVGLVAGFVPAAHEGGRLYSYSLFTSCYVITAVFPMLYTAGQRDGMAPGAPARRRRIAAGAALSLVFVAAVSSATRSVLITASVSVLATMWIKLRGRHTVLWMLLAGIGFFAVFAVVAYSSFWRDYQIADRFLVREIEEESRYEEAKLMLEDLHNDFWSGRGFGSRFESVIEVDGSTLAYAPHIGALTSLYKGGPVVFALLVVWPLIQVSAALTSRAGGAAGGAWCGVLVYYVQGLMSGGWSPAALFLLGAMLSFARRGDSRISAKRRVRSPSPRTRKM